MYKKLLLTVFLTTALLGKEVDDFLLKAQAEVFPRIILLDTDIEKKLVDNKVLLLIAHHDDEELGRYTKELIKTKAFKKMTGLDIEVKTVSIKDISTDMDATAIYLVSSGRNVHKEVVDFAQKKGIISFSYVLDNLNSGLFISLAIENRSKIYINYNTAEQHQINMVDEISAVTVPFNYRP
ncbi:MAG: hypothetical protein U9Q62_05475, partial [Campylobacterota bacterium]|nr:hypothetical protein [Campylobacterota bacterium]